MDQRGTSLSEPCMALGGLFHATSLVHQIAHLGQADNEAVTASLASVLNLNPADIMDVYGQADAIRQGLEFLHAMLQGRAPHREPLRMSVAVLQLERRFSRSAKKQQALGKELELVASSETARINPSASETVTQLADAWIQHVSGIQPKIMVSGNPIYLKDTDNQALIRALLLAALRAAVLWRQVGGSRWRLLLQRKAYLKAAEKLLAA